MCSGTCGFEYPRGLSKPSDLSYCGIIAVDGSPFITLVPTTGDGGPPEVCLAPKARRREPGGGLNGAAEGNDSDDFLFCIGAADSVASGFGKKRDPSGFDCALSADDCCTLSPAPGVKIESRFFGAEISETGEVGCACKPAGGGDVASMALSAATVDERQFRTHNTSMCETNLKGSPARLALTQPLQQAQLSSLFRAPSSS